MKIKQEENRTIVTTNNVVIDILQTSKGRVYVDVYPYDYKKHAHWFLNDEKGKNVYWSEINIPIK